MDKIVSWISKGGAGAFFALSVLLLGSVTASAACFPSDGRVCIGEACDQYGVTHLDGDNTNIIGCFPVNENATSCDTGCVWNRMTSFQHKAKRLQVNQTDLTAIDPACTDPYPTNKSYAACSIACSARCKDLLIEGTNVKYAGGALFRWEGSQAVCGCFY